MSLSARRELLATLAPRYKQAGRAEKGRILDELEQTCGYDRKYAIVALKRSPQSSQKGPHEKGQQEKRKRTRKATYGSDVAHCLVRLWKISRGLCPKRLIPFLPDLIAALERHGEITLTDTVKAKLLKISPATAERLLATHRRTLDQGISTTQPGTLLRHQIPIHTFADWKDAKPGFMEIDLVAHCGDTAAGQFAYTLTMTDVCTGWTECVALPNRGQLAVLMGLEQVMARLPFALLGIDCDNGAEFINVTLKSFCEEQRITFTRGRPYKKNDQCHVEQKNGAVVRPLVGYARYEGHEAVAHLNRLYAVHRLFVNFFCPSMKLIDKTREGAKVSKTYDTAQTPLSRLMASEVWDEAQASAMQRYYETLNPAQLSRRIEEWESGLRHHAVRSEQMGTNMIRPHPKLPKHLFGKIPK